MTNKPMLSVERELLEIYTGRKEGDWVESGHELRAILDKPSEPSKFVGAAQYWSENEQALRDVCRFEGLKGLVYQVVRDRDNPAAQHQGEPVYQIHRFETAGWRDADKDAYESAQNLKGYTTRVLYQHSERAAQAAVVPEGYCIMPRRLTAENGAKTLLLGEFTLKVTMDCLKCSEMEEPSEGCAICNGEGEYGQKHTIPWDQIKFIYSKAVEGLAK